MGPSTARTCPQTCPRTHMHICHGQINLVGYHSNSICSAKTDVKNPKKLLRLRCQISSNGTMFELMKGSSALQSSASTVFTSHPNANPPALKAKQPRPSLPQRIHNQCTQEQPNRNPNRNLNHRVSNIKHDRVELGLLLSNLKKQLAMPHTIPHILQVTIK